MWGDACELPAEGLPLGEAAGEDIGYGPSDAEGEEAASFANL